MVDLKETISKDVEYSFPGAPRHTYNSLGDFEKAEDYLRQASFASDFFKSNYCRLELQRKPIFLRPWSSLSRKVEWTRPELWYMSSQPWSCQSRQGNRGGAWVPAPFRSDTATARCNDARKLGKCQGPFGLGHCEGPLAATAWGGPTGMM